jgi:hypothetical protein
MHRSEILRLAEWRRPGYGAQMRCIQEEDSSLSEVHFEINELQRPSDSDPEHFPPIKFEHYFSLFVHFLHDNEESEIELIEDGYARLSLGFKAYRKFKKYFSLPIKRRFTRAKESLSNKIKSILRLFILAMKWIWKPIGRVLSSEAFIKADKFLDKFRAIKDKVQIFILYYIVVTIHCLKAKHEKYRILESVGNLFGLKKAYDAYLIATEVLSDNRIPWIFTFLIFVPLCILSHAIEGHWYYYSIFFTSGAYTYYFYYIRYKGGLPLEFERVEYFLDWLLVTYTAYGFILCNFMFQDYHYKGIPFVVLCGIIPLYITWDLDLRGEFSDPKHVSRPRRETIYLTTITLMLSILGCGIIGTAKFTGFLFVYFFSVASALFNLMLSAYNEERQDTYNEAEDKRYYWADTSLDFWSIPIGMFMELYWGNRLVGSIIDHLSKADVYFKMALSKITSFKGSFMIRHIWNQDNRRRETTTYMRDVSAMMYKQKKYWQTSAGWERRRRTKVYNIHNFSSVYERARKPVQEILRHRERFATKQFDKWSNTLMHIEYARFYTGWDYGVTPLKRFRTKYRKLMLNRRVRLFRVASTYFDYKLKTEYFLMLHVARKAALLQEREFDEAILKATSGDRRNPAEASEEIYFDR